MKRIGLISGKRLAVITAAGALFFLAACAPAPEPAPAPAPVPPAENGEAVTINISASRSRFDKDTITVPPGADVTIIFDNQDRVPHTLSVYETSAAVEAIFVGEVVSGPGTITYRFTAPSVPGSYFFRCDIHPATMTGDFIVAG